VEKCLPKTLLGATEVAPVSAAEKIVVKQWMLDHPKVSGVGDAERKLLETQIAKLKAYGLSRGYRSISS
jgi:hypothetical protein